MQAIDFVCLYGKNLMKTKLTFWEISVLANITAGRNFSHEIAAFNGQECISMVTRTIKKLEKAGYVKSYQGDSWLVTSEGKALLHELLGFIPTRK